jgi:hypothetical protein
MGYELRYKVLTTAGVVVDVATALLMAGCAGAAPVAATPTNASAPSPGRGSQRALRRLTAAPPKSPSSRVDITVAQQTDR